MTKSQQPTISLSSDHRRSIIQIVSKNYHAGDPDYRITALQSIHDIILQYSGGVFKIQDAAIILPFYLARLVDDNSTVLRSAFLKIDQLLPFLPLAFLIYTLDVLHGVFNDDLLILTLTLPNIPKFDSPTITPYKNLFTAILRRIASSALFDTNTSFNVSDINNEVASVCLLRKSLHYMSSSTNMNHSWSNLPQHTPTLFLAPVVLQRQFATLKAQHANTKVLESLIGNSSAKSEKVVFAHDEFFDTPCRLKVPLLGEELVIPQHGELSSEDSPALKPKSKSSSSPSSPSESSSLVDISSHFSITDVSHYTLLSYFFTVLQSAIISISITLSSSEDVWFSRQQSTSPTLSTLYRHFYSTSAGLAPGLEYSDWICRPTAPAIVRSRLRDFNPQSIRQISSLCCPNVSRKPLYADLLREINTLLLLPICQQVQHPTVLCSPAILNADRAFQHEQLSAASTNAFAPSLIGKNVTGYATNNTIQASSTLTINGDAQSSTDDRSRHSDISFFLDPDILRDILCPDQKYVTDALYSTFIMILKYLFHSLRENYVTAPVFQALVQLYAGSASQNTMVDFDSVTSAISSPAITTERCQSQCATLTSHEHQRLFLSFHALLSFLPLRLRPYVINSTNFCIRSYDHSDIIQFTQAFVHCMNLQHTSTYAQMDTLLSLLAMTQEYVTTIQWNTTSWQSVVETSEECILEDRQLFSPFHAIIVQALQTCYVALPMKQNYHITLHLSLFSHLLFLLPPALRLAQCLQHVVQPISTDATSNANVSSVPTTTAQQQIAQDWTLLVSAASSGSSNGNLLQSLSSTMDDSNTLSTWEPDYTVIAQLNYSLSTVSTEQWTMIASILASAQSIALHLVSIAVDTSPPSYRQTDHESQIFHQMYNPANTLAEPKAGSPALLRQQGCIHNDLFPIAARPGDKKISLSDSVIRGNADNFSLACSVSTIVSSFYQQILLAVIFVHPSMSPQTPIPAVTGQIDTVLAIGRVVASDDTTTTTTNVELVEEFDEWGEPIVPTAANGGGGDDDDDDWGDDDGTATDMQADAFYDDYDDYNTDYDLEDTAGTTTTVPTTTVVSNDVMNDSIDAAAPAATTTHLLQFHPKQTMQWMPPRYHAVVDILFQQQYSEDTNTLRFSAATFLLQFIRTTLTTLRQYALKYSSETDPAVLAAASASVLCDIPDNSPLAVVLTTVPIWGVAARLLSVYTPQFQLSSPLNAIALTDLVLPAYVHSSLMRFDSHHPVISITQKSLLDLPMTMLSSLHGSSFIGNAPNNATAATADSTSSTVQLFSKEKGSWNWSVASPAILQRHYNTHELSQLLLGSTPANSSVTSLSGRLVAKSASPQHAVATNNDFSALHAQALVLPVPIATATTLTREQFSLHTALNAVSLTRYAVPQLFNFAAAMLSPRATHINTALFDSFDAFSATIRGFLLFLGPNADDILHQTVTSGQSTFLAPISITANNGASRILFLAKQRMLFLLLDTLLQIISTTLSWVTSQYAYYQASEQRNNENGMNSTLYTARLVEYSLLPFVELFTVLYSSLSATDLFPALAFAALHKTDHDHVGISTIAQMHLMSSQFSQQLLRMLCTFMPSPFISQHVVFHMFSLLQHLSVVVLSIAPQFVPSGPQLASQLDSIATYLVETNANVPSSVSQTDIFAHPNALLMSVLSLITSFQSSTVLQFQHLHSFVWLQNIAQLSNAEVSLLQASQELDVALPNNNALNSDISTVLTSVLRATTLESDLQSIVQATAPSFAPSSSLITQLFTSLSPWVLIRVVLPHIFAAALPRVVTAFSAFLSQCKAMTIVSGPQSARLVSQNKNNDLEARIKSLAANSRRLRKRERAPGEKPAFVFKAWVNGVPGVYKQNLEKHRAFYDHYLGHDTQQLQQQQSSEKVAAQLQNNISRALQAEFSPDRSLLRVCAPAAQLSSHDDLSVLPDIQLCDELCASAGVALDNLVLVGFHAIQLWSKLPSNLVLEALLLQTLSTPKTRLTSSSTTAYLSELKNVFAPNQHITTNNSPISIIQALTATTASNDTAHRSVAIASDTNIDSSSDALAALSHAATFAVPSSFESLLSLVVSTALSPSNNDTSPSTSPRATGSNSPSIAALTSLLAVCVAYLPPDFLLALQQYAFALTPTVVSLFTSESQVTSPPVLSRLIGLNVGMLHAAQTLISVPAATSQYFWSTRLATQALIQQGRIVQEQSGKLIVPFIPVLGHLLQLSTHTVVSFHVLFSATDHAMCSSSKIASFPISFSPAPDLCLSLEDSSLISRFDSLSLKEQQQQQLNIVPNPPKRTLTEEGLNSKQPTSPHPIALPTSSHLATLLPCSLRTISITESFLQGQISPPRSGESSGLPVSAASAPVATVLLAAINHLRLFTPLLAETLASKRVIPDRLQDCLMTHLGQSVSLLPSLLGLFSRILHYEELDTVLAPFIALADRIHAAVLSFSVQFAQFSPSSNAICQVESILPSPLLAASFPVSNETPAVSQISNDDEVPAGPVTRSRGMLGNLARRLIRSSTTPAASDVPAPTTKTKRTKRPNMDDDEPKPENVLPVIHPDNRHFIDYRNALFTSVTTTIATTGTCGQAFEAKATYETLLNDIIAIFVPVMTTLARPDLETAISLPVSVLTFADLIALVPACPSIEECCSPVFQSLIRSIGFASLDLPPSNRSYLQHVVVVLCALVSIIPSEVLLQIKLNPTQVDGITNSIPHIVSVYVETAQMAKSTSTNNLSSAFAVFIARLLTFATPSITMTLLSLFSQVLPQLDQANTFQNIIANISQLSPLFVLYINVISSYIAFMHTTTLSASSSSSSARGGEIAFTPFSSALNDTPFYRLVLAPLFRIAPATISIEEDINDNDEFTQHALLLPRYLQLIAQICAGKHITATAQAIPCENMVDCQTNAAPFTSFIAQVLFLCPDISWIRFMVNHAIVTTPGNTAKSIVVTSIPQFSLRATDSAHKMVFGYRALLLIAALQRGFPTMKSFIQQFSVTPGVEPPAALARVLHYLHTTHRYAASLYTADLYHQPASPDPFVVLTQTIFLASKSSFMSYITTLLTTEQATYAALCRTSPDQSTSISGVFAPDLNIEQRIQLQSFDKSYSTSSPFSQRVDATVVTKVGQYYEQFHLALQTANCLVLENGSRRNNNNNNNNTSQEDNEMVVENVGQQLSSCVELSFVASTLLSHSLSYVLMFNTLPMFVTATAPELEKPTSSISCPILASQLFLRQHLLSTSPLAITSSASRVQSIPSQFTTTSLNISSSPTFPSLVTSSLEYLLHAPSYRPALSLSPYLCIFDMSFPSRLEQQLVCASLLAEASVRGYLIRVVEQGRGKHYFDPVVNIRSQAIDFLRLLVVTAGRGMGRALSPFFSNRQSADPVADPPAFGHPVFNAIARALIDYEKVHSTFVFRSVFGLLSTLILLNPLPISATPSLSVFVGKESSDVSSQLNMTDSSVASLAISTLSTGQLALPCVPLCNDYNYDQLLFLQAGQLFAWYLHNAYAAPSQTTIAVEQTLRYMHYLPLLDLPYRRRYLAATTPQQRFDHIFIKNKASKDLSSPNLLHFWYTYIVRTDQK